MFRWSVCVTLFCRPRKSRFKRVLSSTLYRLCLRKEKAVYGQNTRSSNADKMRRIGFAGIVRRSDRMRRMEKPLSYRAENPQNIFSGRWIFYGGVPGFKIKFRKIFTMFQKLFLQISKYDIHIDGYQITIPIFLRNVGFS